MSSSISFQRLAKVAMLPSAKGVRTLTVLRPSRMRKMRGKRSANEWAPGTDGAPNSVRRYVKSGPSTPWCPSIRR